VDEGQGQNFREIDRQRKGKQVEKKGENKEKRERNTRKTKSSNSGN